MSWAMRVPSALTPVLIWYTTAWRQSLRKLSSAVGRRVTARPERMARRMAIKCSVLSSLEPNPPPT